MVLRRGGQHPHAGVWQDGRTERVSTTYDPTNRPRTTTVENGFDDLVTTYTYDERGNRLSATDANGNTTSTTYDVLDRPVRRTLPQASVKDVGGDARTTTSQLQVGYDTFGATTHTEDARGNLTTVDIDLLGRETVIHHPTYTTPDGQQVSPVEEFAYDGVGNLVSRTDRRGATTDFESTRSTASSDRPTRSSRAQPRAGRRPTPTTTGGISSASSIPAARGSR